MREQLMILRHPPLSHPSPEVKRSEGLGGLLGGGVFPWFSSLEDDGRTLVPGHSGQD